MTDPDIVEQAVDLRVRENAAGTPQDLVTSLVRGLARQKRNLRWIAFSVFLDVLLSIALAIAFINIAHNTDTVKNSCMSGNEFRKNDRQLWDFILTLPAGPGQSPIQVLTRQQNEKALNAYLNKTFALRVCK